MTSTTTSPDVAPALDMEYWSGIIESGSVDLPLAEIHRAELLPLLFRVKGKPYSLEDYPQFRVFYDKEYTTDFICMSARQCGKSLNLSNSEVLDTVQIPHFQILYVAPLQSQAQRFSTQYLTQSIRSCAFAQHLQSQALEGQLSDSKIVKAVFHNSFANGAGIQIGYAKTSADRLRGITVDCIDFDEIQDQIIDNIDIVKESLTTSDWKRCRYTGTAKTLDNTIESLWRQSSRCEWVMRCGCGYWNIPDDQEDCRCLRMVRATGMHCLKCGRRLDVAKGEWVPFAESKMDSFRGYHVSQVVVPANVNNSRRWNAIISKISSQPLTRIKNEILGISASTGARIISSDDIAKHSVLPTMAELQKVFKRNYVMTLSGVDWGGAEHTSFTVHVIVGVTRDGKVDVLYAKRYIGYDPDTRLKDIADAHRFYRCRMLVADYGMGFDQNVMLAQRFGIVVVQMQFTGNQKSLLRWSPKLRWPCWSISKHTALTYMFLAIKYGTFRFPSDPHFKYYTQDLLSPFEEVQDRGGVERRVFTRDPAMPDDFAMALCFVSIAAFKAIHGDVTRLIPENGFGVDDPVSGSPDVSTAADPRELLKSAT